MINPKYHLFICTSCRINGKQQGVCFSKGSVDIIGSVMNEIEERDLSGEVMVNNTGCFGICDKGPIMVVYPQGIWYGNLTSDDIEEIFDKHIEGGQIVTRLQI